MVCPGGCESVICVNNVKKKSKCCNTGNRVPYNPRRAAAAARAKKLRNYINNKNN